LYLDVSLKNFKQRTKNSNDRDKDASRDFGNKKSFIDVLNDHSVSAINSLRSLSQSKGELQKQQQMVEREKQKIVSAMKELDKVEMKLTTSIGQGRETVDELFNADYINVVRQCLMRVFLESANFKDTSQLVAGENAASSLKTKKNDLYSDTLIHLIKQICRGIKMAEGFNKKKVENLVKEKDERIALMQKEIEDLKE
jgi:ABC-type transporter Mla subunit MlaD